MRVANFSAFLNVTNFGKIVTIPADISKGWFWFIMDLLAFFVLVGVVRADIDDKLIYASATCMVVAILLYSAHALAGVLTLFFIGLFLFSIIFKVFFS